MIGAAIGLLGDVLRPLSAGQWVARTLIATLPILAMALAGAAGARLPWWLQVVVVLGSLAWAVFPESAAGATVLGVVVIWWGMDIGSDLDPLLLPASAALLGAHVASVVVSYGPPGMGLDASVVRLWLRRAALVYLAVPVTYAVAVAVEDGPSPDAVWPAALAATFAAVAAASVTLSLRRPYDESAAASHGTGMVHGFPM